MCIVSKLLLFFFYLITRMLMAGHHPFSFPFSISICLSAFQNQYISQWTSPMAQQIESACNSGDAGNTGSTPLLGRSSGGENGNSLQYSCLENPMDRGAWQTTVHGVAKSWTLLSMHISHTEPTYHPPSETCSSLH